MATNKYNDEYYKVSFITTHSPNIPNMLKYTGGLIVMSDLSSKDPTTGKNRMSIWLRGEQIASGIGFSSSYLMTNGTWWANAYNRVFGPNGAKAFDPLSDYNKGNGDDIPAYTSYGSPMSVSNKIDFVYSYLRESNDYLEDRVAYSISYTNKVSAIINAYLNEVKKKHDADVSNINTYLTSYRLDSYNYTDYQIEKLVGGAPDFLDTLGEISYWLKNAQELGINTVSEIMDIKSKYVTHDDVDDNGYTYLSEKSWKTVKSDKPEIGYVYAYTWTQNKDGSYTKEWKKTEDTYEYYTYTTEEAGTIAIKPKQVTTPFEGHNLEEILKKIITPYPYATPSVTPITIENKDASEWYEDPVPVGSSISNVDVLYDIRLNDAIRIEKLTVNEISGDVSTLASISSPTLKMSFSNIREGKNIIATAYTISHGPANAREYPQLEGMNPPVYDVDHAFNDSTTTSFFTDPIYKIGKYEVYVCENSQPTDMSSFANEFGKTIYGTKFFIDGDTTSGTGISDVMNASKKCTLECIVIPTLLLSDNYSIYIVDENTKIEQCIYTENGSEYASDVVSVTKESVSGTHYGMSFTKIALKSSRYPFSNSFRFKVDY